MPDAEPLPLGWFEHIDATSGRPYFHNQASGETSWVRPLPAAPQDLPQPPAQSQPSERTSRKPSSTSPLKLFAAADAKPPGEPSPVAAASKETTPHRSSSGRSVPSRPAAPLPPKRASVTGVGGKAPSFVPPPSRSSSGGTSPPRSQGSTSPSGGPARRPSATAGSPRASSTPGGLTPKSRLGTPQSQRFLSMYNKSSSGRGAGRRPSYGSSANSAENRSNASSGGSGSNSRSRTSSQGQPASKFEEKSPTVDEQDGGNRERLSSTFVPETEDFTGGARPISMENPLAAKPRESSNASNPLGLDTKAMHCLSTASSVLMRASIHDFDFPCPGSTTNNNKRGSGGSSSNEGSSSSGAARGTAEEAKALFKRVDKNGDGALEFAEVALLLAEAGLESTPEHTAGAMREMLLAGGSISASALDHHSDGANLQDVTLEDFTAWYASDSSSFGSGGSGGGGAGGGVMSISAALALQEQGMASEAEDLEEEAVSLRASVAVATESKGRRLSTTFGGTGLRFSSALAAVPEPAPPGKGGPTSNASTSRAQQPLELRKAEGEYRRMSLVITSSSSEAVLEVFSELTNSIGRLRTTLLAAASNNYHRAPSPGQGAGGISFGDLGSSLKTFGGGNSSSNGSNGYSGHGRGGGGGPSSNGGGGGFRVGALSLLGRLGQDGSARDFAKSLSKIGAALHSSLQVLDAIRALQEPSDEIAALNPQAASSSSSSDQQLYVGSSSPVRASQWARFAARFKEDLSSARDQLGEVAILLADICGPSASLEATTLVDTMVERIGRRVSQLELAVEAAQALEDTTKQNKMKLLEEEFAAEAEVERQQMIKETAIISQKCHRSGELEKQPIVQREMTTSNSADAAGAEDSLSFADSRSKGGGGGSSSGGAGFLRSLVSGSKNGGDGKSGGSWQKRYFFLDYQSLLYTENTKAAKQAQEAAAAKAKESGGVGSMSQHAAVSLPSSWRPDDANATKMLLDHTSEAKLAPRNDRSNSSSSGNTASQGNGPTVFVLSHATYELPIRAPSMEDALAWIEAINKCASVHRARYDKTRQWFIKKSQAQWWGSLLPDPRAVSVKNWERLFKSVVHVSSQSENGRQVNAITPSTLDQPQKGSSSPGGSSAASVPPSSGAAAAATSPTALSRVELGEDVQSASVEGLRCRLGMRCKGHGDHVTVVAWSSDGRHVVSGSKESKVLVWAVPNTNLLELGTRDSSGRGDNNHNGNDGPSSSSSGGNSLNDGRSPMGGDAADSGAPTTLAAASRVGSGDLTPAEVAKAMTMGLKPAEELAMGREANWTMACCFSPSNRRVAVAGLNQKISVGDWRFQHGRNYALHPVGNGDEHLGSVTSLCFMGASDSLLASGCSDSYLRVWDLGGSGKMVTRLSAQEDEVLCLAGHAWAPHLVMSGGADCVVRLHDVRLPNGPSTVCTLRGAESDVEDVRAFGASSTTANFLAAASRDGHLRVHDVRYPKAPAMTSLVTEPRGYTAVDFSPDGRWLFAAVAGGHAWQVMDAYTGRVVLQVRGHGGVVSCLRATNDGRVITGGDDHQLCVWNVDTPHFW